MSHPEIYIHPNKVPSEFCKTIINSFEYALKLKPSGFHAGPQSHPLERKDTAGYADDFELKDEFKEAYLHNHIEFNGEMSIEINRYLDEALVGYCERFEALKKMNLRSIRQKLQRTPIGGGYHIWHHEQGTLHTSERVIVWTIYLNDVKEGGETEFLYQSMRVPAEEGKILIFPASFTHTHRGNPPLSNVKYIVTGWHNLY